MISYQGWIILHCLLRTPESDPRAGVDAVGFFVVPAW